MTKHIFFDNAGDFVADGRKISPYEILPPERTTQESRQAVFVVASWALGRARTPDERRAAARYCARSRPFADFAAAVLGARPHERGRRKADRRAVNDARRERAGSYQPALQPPQ